MCSSRSYLWSLPIDERQERLEVPVADVGDVEADEPASRPASSRVAGPVRRGSGPLNTAGIRRGLSRESHRVRGSRSSRKAAPSSRSAAGATTGPRKPSGSTSGLSKTQRRRRSPAAPMHDGDADQEDVGAAIHGRQSRDAADPVLRAGERASPGGVDGQPDPVARRRAAGRADATASTSPSRSTSTTSRTWLGRDPRTVTTRRERPVGGRRRSAERRTATAGAGGEPGGGQQPRPRRRPRGPGRSRGRAPSRRRPGRATPRRSVPAWTTRPARITASRSATVNASSWSWVTISAVVPAATQDVAQVARPAARAARRRARDSGSSSSSSRGSTASARARATRCRSPPDSVAGRRSAYPLEPDQGEQLGDPASALAARRAPQPQRVADVARDGEVREELAVLEHQREAAPVGRDAGQVGAVPATTRPPRPARGRRPRAAAWTCRSPDGPSTASTRPSARSRSASCDGGRPVVGHGDVVERRARSSEGSHGRDAQPLDGEHHAGGGRGRGPRRRPAPCRS